MVMLEFAMAPGGKGESVSEYVARSNQFGSSMSHWISGVAPSKKSVVSAVLRVSRVTPAWKRNRSVKPACGCCNYAARPPAAAATFCACAREDTDSVARKAPRETAAHVAAATVRLENMVSRGYLHTRPM